MKMFRAVHHILLGALLLGVPVAAAVHPDGRPFSFSVALKQSAVVAVSILGLLAFNFMLARIASRALAARFRDRELEARLCASAVKSVRAAGSVPENFRALTFDWRWVPDPNDPSNRPGFHVTWRVYVGTDLSEDDEEYINESSSGLVSELWSRIVRVEDKVTIGGELPPKPDTGWLYLRTDENA